ncbi:hypothetical protein ES319_D12G030800v1 [Gossypium barbadense]|uniref:Uncharacterized protein n=1 Tax=Gossypium barbadense TaxID=3634 RepID=A0A5J5NT91_GOSBA|nr:hypothetical protein ES319_D12G030800v1 [Gossypium barbadense]
MSAPIIDLSKSVVGHFFITVIESSIISRILKPIEIPNCMACNPACASAANGDATSEWRTVFDSKSSPLHLVLPILKQIWKIVDQKLRQSKLSPAFSYRHVYGLCLFLRITKVRNKKYDIVR